MTEVTFFKRNGKLLGFSAEGHSGYAEEGNDIICAAISAVTQTAAIYAEEVLKIDGAVTQDEEQTLLSVICEGGEGWSSLLKAMEIYLTEVAGQYPKYLTTRITEV